MGRPYQPSLLRLLHAATALLAAAAWITGLLVYLSADGRALSISWRTALQGEQGWLGNGWIDIHGSAGVVLLPVAVLLAAYAITLGRARLRRAGNAMPLLALALAIGSGKLMDEDWLRQGALDHPVYLVHLLAWILLAGSLAFHLVAAFRLGGLPLLRAMFRTELQKHDRPGQWPAQVRHYITTVWLR